ncbi:uncharacterized protein BXZ73DRAFT_38314 [Epithele typhae]|uniref:uncharacterized protein n=1 Tax=Epithele typhae TaxID=378194 RepID=UPI0020077D29|nr:uncharacterized protein BXZ73DRAFT_38314 [Epithele typhae]KAH9945481.1 hypothetical protein BXZ73DRAFT_38314 [Epithele typhae]
MLPNNFVVSGQSGMPQGQSQGQPGMNNMLWLQQQQQRQQQLQQQQNQLGAFHSPQVNGNGGQMNQQMLQMLRQQQPAARQMNFSGMQHLAGNNASPFQHDPSQGLQNVHAQVGNAPTPQNINQLQMQAMRAGQPNGMFSAQGGSMNRQLDMLMAHNQENQRAMGNNASMAMVQRALQQQSQLQSQGPQQSHHQMNATQIPGLFPGGPNMNAASMNPNLASSMQLAQMRQQQLLNQSQQGLQDSSLQSQQNGAGQGQARQPSIHEMNQRATALRSGLNDSEARLKNLQNQPGVPMTDQLAMEITKVQKEVEMRRQALSRALIIMQNLQNRGVAGFPNGANGNAGAGGFPNAAMKPPMVTSPVPPQRMAAGPQNPGQPNWMSQTGASPSMNNTPRPMPQNMRMPGGQAPGISTPQLPPQMTPQAGQHLQRPGTTTGLNPGGAPLGAGQPSQPGMPNGMGVNGMNRQQMVGAPFQPLARETFQKAFYDQWLPKHGAKDHSILHFEGRDIDLYQLHCEVITQGTFQTVSNLPGRAPGYIPYPFEQVKQKDLWPVIGARMGWVHFPGTDTEPGRAGPALASHLEHIYTEFLKEFDNQYLRQLVQHRRTQMAKAAAESGGAPRAPPALAEIAAKDPKVMGEIVSYSNLSVQEMQARGLPPNVIAIVDRYREQLKPMLEQQQSFAKNIQNAQGQRNVSNPMFSGMPGQSSANTPMANAQQASMNMAAQMQHLQNMQQAQQQAQAQQQQGMQASGSMMPNGQQVQQMAMNGQRGPMIAGFNRPTPQQSQAAMEMVKRIRDENKTLYSNAAHPLQIPDSQRLQYGHSFDQLYHLVVGLDQNLPHFAVCMKEDVIKKLVIMINAVHQQRDLLSGQGPPKYLMPLEWVKQMIVQVQQANFMFKGWLNGRPTFPGQQPGMAPQPQPPRQNGQAPPLSQQSPSAPTPIASSPPAPAARTPSATSPPFVAGTPVQKIPQKPTPKSESASTPTHTVNSPAAAPQTPKVKAAAKPSKPKPVPRKSSKAIAPSPSAGPSEVKPPSTPAAAPATPVQSAPTPEPSSGMKRPREDETGLASGQAVAPAAKKTKSNFDDQPSDVLVKREMEAESIKTDDDASKFFDQMTSWLSQVSGDGDDGQGNLLTIARTLEDILQPYTTNPDDSGLALSLLGGASPKMGGATVDPADFFDFVSYELPEVDAGSKAATPDLVLGSSSVGPSPGSASETEAHPPASVSAADTAKIAEPKTEESDSIPSDLWRAIDGGEAGFYNSSQDWKWDQPMAPVDQPWAIYPSS